jgi:hypothetical protein
VTDLKHNFNWMLTGVYGPQGELEKKMPLRDLNMMKQSAHPNWLVLGDFNMIYNDQDKNNTRLNRRVMNKSIRTLNHLEIKEIQLIGKNLLGAIVRKTQQ